MSNIDHEVVNLKMMETYHNAKVYGAVNVAMLERVRDMRSLEFFNSRWATINNVLNFKGEWSYPYEPGSPLLNSWAALDAVQLRGVPPGKIFRATHTESGQRLMFVGTRLGCAAVYMGTDRNGSTGIHYDAVNNLLSSGFLAMPLGRSLDVQGVRHILGSGPLVRRGIEVPNIGDKIEAVYNHFTDPERHPLYLL